jgi:signal transduction histidine kinase
MAAGLLRGQDMPAILGLGVREVAQGLGVSRVAIMEAGGSSSLHLLASSSDDDLAEEDLTAIEPLFTRTLAGPQPLILPANGNGNGNGTEQVLADALPVAHAASWMSCSMVGIHGPAGMLCVLSERPRCFTADDGRFLQSAADLLSAAITRLQSEMCMNSLCRELNRNGIRRALHLLGQDLVQELSQPATAALNYLYSCRRPETDGGSEPAEIDRLQGRAIAEIRRLTGIVGRLRETLKEGEVDYESTDINTLIEAVLMLLRFDIAGKNIQLAYNPQPDLPAIRVDKAMMLQLFFNLFRICIDATHQSVRRDLWVTTRYVTRERIEIRIAGSAPGIEGKALDNRRLSGSVKGMESEEIDMAICRHIIDVHEGGFRATVLPGGGITLSITLPLHER